MPLTLYYNEISAPVRSCLLTIHAIGVQDKVKLEKIDIMAGQQMSPDYLKKNPLHTVPTLEDDGFVVYDSHAINAYLVEKYAKDDSLYPKDVKKRATVDQRLHFENGVLFQNIKPILFSLNTGAGTVPTQLIETLDKALESLEILFGNDKFSAGSQLTIADFSIATTVSALNVMVPIDAKKFPKITEWLKRMDTIPYFKQINGDGLGKFEQLVKSLKEPKPK